MLNLFQHLKNMDCSFSKRHFIFSKLVVLVLLILNISILSAQETKQSVTTITINNARQTSYKKDEETGNDTIILEGSVVLTVQKDNSTSEITAEKITYDRKTEMLYAEGDVSIVTKDSSSGNDTATADSLLLNTSTLEAVFDGGKVVQTQSDALSLPSGSTLIVFSEIFGRSESNVIAFKNSSLTFCDDPDPHWHIDASITWLLPGGEFAFLNALLYVGAIPVFYLPAFYYPKDELIFNPVFGSTDRTGTFVQNTYYIKGRKTSTDTSSSSSSTSDTTAETMKSLYNFMKPSVLKEQRREGLMMHNLDEDYKGSSSQYIKIMADWYENLGYMTGIAGSLTPSQNYITALNFDARLGFSNTVYGTTGSYTFLDDNGLKTMDDSQFLGLTLPFRYGGNFSMTLSKPFKLTLSLPFYSDPYFSNDFYTRNESMDWISYLMSLAGTDDDTTTINTVSSYSWQLAASQSVTLPAFIKPYISSFSWSWNSAVNISSKTTDSTVLEKMVEDSEGELTSDWKSYTPRKMFYYPSQVTPASVKLSLSGTIFEYPKTAKTKTSTENKSEFVAFNKPDEFKTEKELAADEEKRQKLEKEKLAAEKNAENSEENKTEAENAAATAEAAETTETTEAGDSEKNENSFEYVPVFPALTGTVPSVSTAAANLTYKLAYTIAPDLVTQLAYSNSNLKSSEDFDWNNPKSFMYTIKSPLTLTSTLAYGSDIFTLSDKLSWDPIWQGHPYINSDTDLGGYSETEKKSLVKADYTASSQSLIGTQSLSVKPFKSFSLLKDSKISHSINLKLFRYVFNGSSDDEDWEETWQTAFEKYTLNKIDWNYEDEDTKNDPESYFTSNSIDFSLSSSQLDSKVKETVTLSSILWPLTQKYTGSFALTLPNTTFSISTAYTPEQTYNSEHKTDVSETWAPISQSFSYSINLFDSPLKFTESLAWDKSTGVVKDSDGNITSDEFGFWEKFTSFKLSTSWKFISASYVMSYTLGAKLAQDGHSITEGWINDDEKKFQPYTFTVSANPSTKSYFNNHLTFGLSTSVNVDLIKATNTYLTFAPTMTIKTPVMNITFSSTSRNSVLYWYFHDEISTYQLGNELPDWIDWADNMLIDLIRSYNFGKESDRKASGYKLKSLSMTMSHDLHDWKFNMSLSVSPRLVTTNGKKTYSFDPYMTIGVVWNPMSSIKTEITDEYGEWELN